MANKKRAVLAAVFAAAYVSQLAGGAQAEAAPELSRIAGDLSPDNSLTVKSAEAKCPGSTRLVGGGGRIEDHGSGKVMLSHLTPMRQSAEPDRYEVSAQVTDPLFTGNWSLQAFAICASGRALPRNLGMYQGNSDSQSVTFKAGAKGCPAGQRALSAGASTRYGLRAAGLQLVRTSGTRDITRGTARVPQDDPYAWTLTTTAICASYDPDLDPIVEVAGTVAHNSAQFTIACPPGSKVYGAGGGGSLTDSGKVFLRAVYPSADLLRVTVSMTAAPVDGMAVQAICVHTP